MESWENERRVVAKIEWPPGELIPKVGFIVTNMKKKPEDVVEFYNKRGTAEQYIKGNCSPPIQAPKTPQQFQSQLLCQDASFTFGYDDLRRQILILSLRL